MVRQSGKAESRITGGRDQAISNRADLVLDDAQRSRMRVTGGCRSRLIAAETASSPASSKSLNSLGQRCLATTCCERKRSLPFVVNGFLQYGPRHDGTDTSRLGKLPGKGNGAPSETFLASPISDDGETTC